MCWFKMVYIFSRLLKAVHILDLYVFHNFLLVIVIIIICSFLFAYFSVDMFQFRLFFSVFFLCLVCHQY